MKKRLLLLVLSLASCRAPSATPAQQSPSAATLAPARTLTVFAASSLTDAFSEIGSTFEAQHPGVKIRFNFAGSQALRTQILEGAPADVFASASPFEMQALETAGLVDAGESQIFATNMIVVILPANNPARIESLEQLAQPGIKLVMASEQVPAGRYARVTLRNMDADYGDEFDRKVLSNVVSNEENVRQVLAKVQLGEADAGFVYQSDTLAAPGLPVIVIPAHYGGIAEYPVAALKAASEPDLAREFAEALLSEAGQAALQAWGFGGRTGQK